MINISRSSRLRTRVGLAADGTENADRWEMSDRPADDRLLLFNSQEEITYYNNNCVIDRPSASSKREIN